MWRWWVSSARYRPIWPMSGTGHPSAVSTFAEHGSGATPKAGLSRSLVPDCSSRLLVLEAMMPDAGLRGIVVGPARVRQCSGGDRLASAGDPPALPGRQ